MDRIINSISEIECDSVKIMDDANAKKSEIFTRIQKETKAYDQQVEDTTNARIQELRSKMEKDMEEKLTTQKNAADNYFHDLEAHYKKNHGSYVERLFRDMTGV